ncbi:MAG: hypothetical protein KDC48_21195, partial [Planctomycetes bacterium]|nr:hypothetical protein [Planctomycetota bacterium]
VPIADVGWRLELGGHDALALSISALGGDRFGARWQRQRLDGPTWQTTAELGSCVGTFPTGEPLQFVVRWSGGALRASCGPPGAPDAALAEVKPATDWQVPWRPGRLQLRADRGVAVFTDWRLAATDR